MQIIMVEQQQLVNSMRILLGNTPVLYISLSRRVIDGNKNVMRVKSNYTQTHNYFANSLEIYAVVVVLYDPPSQRH